MGFVAAAALMPQVSLVREDDARLGEEARVKEEGRRGKEEGKGVGKGEK